MNTSIPEIVSAEELAALLDLDPRSIRMLAERHRNIRAGRGQYRVKDAVLARIAESARSPEADLESIERSRLLSAQRQIAELRAAQASRELIPVSEAFDVVDTVIAVFREGLARLPRQISRDPVIQKTVIDLCNNMLREASERFAELEKGEKHAKD